jgi:Beta-lactamase enzyme family
MNMRRRLRLCPGSALALTAALAAGGAAYCGGGAAAAAGVTLTAASTPAAASVCSSKAHPRLAAEISRGIADALRGRSSIVGIDAEDPADRIACQYHPWWNFPSASVVKVIILGTLLRELQTTHQHIGPGQAALARAMITQSDNDAATALWNEVGMARLQSFLTAAGMSHTDLPDSGFWGLTEVNAHDELLLLRLLVTKNKVLDGASRAYALNLMAQVIPSQRWGAPAGAPANVTVHVKNGWLPDPALWVINSIGDFTHRGGAYSIAILTRDNPSMAYGVSTVASVASPINRGLAGYAQWVARRSP